jgi:hypothetical protein
LKYPFLFLLHNRWFQFLLFTWGVTELYLGSSSAQRFQVYGVSRFKSYRIFMEKTSEETLLSSQTTSIEPYFERAVFLTLLHRGCALLSIDAASNASSPLATNFANPEYVDGFRLDIRPWAFAAAPLLIPPFLLQGRNYDDSGSEGAQWTDIGAAHFRLTTQGLRILCKSSGGLLVGTDGAAFDLRAPWPLVLAGSWVPLVTGLFLMCAAACGAAGRAGLGRTLTAGFLAFLAFNLAIIGKSICCISRLDARYSKNFKVVLRRYTELEMEAPPLSFQRPRFKVYSLLQAPPSRLLGQPPGPPIRWV